MPEPQVFQQKLTVTASHLDEMNHVNNVQYLQWIQDVAKGHWEQAAAPIWLERYAWVVLNHFIEYKKPACLGNQLLIQTHVDSFTGPKSNRLVRITNEETQELIVQSSTWWCMIDRKTNRPVRVTQEMLTSFEGAE